MNCIHSKPLTETCLNCGMLPVKAGNNPRAIVIDAADLDGAISDLMAVKAAMDAETAIDSEKELMRVVPIERRAVESSNLASVGYDGTLNVLEVEFKTGDVYRYFGVPIDVGLGLIDAPSKGKYFHANIITGGFKFECMFKANRDVAKVDEL